MPPHLLSRGRTGLMTSLLLWAPFAASDAAPQWWGVLAMYVAGVFGGMCSGTEVSNWGWARVAFRGLWVGGTVLGWLIIAGAVLTRADVPPIVLAGVVGALAAEYGPFGHGRPGVLAGTGSDGAPPQRRADDAEEPPAAGDKGALHE